ncbi:MAG: hypothetical protein HYW89_03175 [Candidatus Sungiibacteriota bacterium]|uniref:Uncharacterized protein n=1 Tax=Candidatus Sungiibacteriota bacterium TaxID=2750080 RepID=A0A7T5RIV6_9BACT|nr:MAG: hypothetical protein HYW89_03175 [Candidatus Sungbacteria bacterium]
MQHIRSPVRMLVLLFLLLLVPGIGFGQDGSDYGMAAPSPPTPPSYYTPADFYYLDKEGRRVTLEVHPGAVMLWFPDGKSESDITKSLSEIANMFPQTQIGVEKILLPLGVKELKRIFFSRTVYVLQFSSPVNIISALNLLATRQELIDVAPIVYHEDSWTFPSGVWARTKPLAKKQLDALLVQISAFGYSSLRATRPVDSGWPNRLEYFSRAFYFKGEPINPLRFSRLLAEDIKILWSVPDFTPLVPWIRIRCEVTRPSGTINDPFVFGCGIKFDPKRIKIDVDQLKKLSGINLKPESVLPGLFRTEAPVVIESPGEITLKISFRVYQPSEKRVGNLSITTFDLGSLPIYYAMVGAPPNLPPQIINTTMLPIRISALVPRDNDGNPTVTDILGWKRIPVSEALLPIKPEKSVYSQTDLRYWASLFKEYSPKASLRMRQAGGGIVILVVTMVLATVSLKTIKASLRRRKYPYQRFRRELARIRSVSYICSLTIEEQHKVLLLAKSVLRSLLNQPQGKTDSELLQESPEPVRELVDKILSILNNRHEGQVLLSEEIEEMAGLFRKLLWDMRVVRLWGKLSKMVRKGV